MKKIEIKKSILIAGIALTLGTSFINNAYSQLANQPIKVQKSGNTYPDEFSELDETPFTSQNIDKNIAKALELANEKYKKAIELIAKKDKAEAKKLLDSSFEILNKLSNYPKISDNKDVQSLVEKITDTYEANFTSLNELDENSPAVVVRDKFTKDIDKATENSPDIKTLAPDQRDAVVVTNPVPSTSLLSYPVGEQEYIQKHINYLSQTKAKKFFEKWMERSTKWFPMMKRIIAEENMPEEIIYLSMIESGLNATVVSHASAVGLWQFMMETGRDYNLNKDYSFWKDERRDPEKATRAAMLFLNDLYNNFGDWHLALAAYNCGQGKVQKTINQSKLKNPSYWDIRKMLPKETSHYVGQYIAAALIAMNPKAYGCNTDTLKFQDEYKYDIFTLKEPTSLKALNYCANGGNQNLIKDLNPEILRSITPPDATEYRLKIPFGSKQDFITKFSGLTIEEKQPWITHIVKRKETLALLAERYNVPKNELLAMNDIRNIKSKLQIGSQIKIPIDADSYNSINEDYDQKLAIAEKSKPTTKIEEDNSNITHTVKKGETLFSIARRYGLSIDEIKNLNDITKSNENVKFGQELIIGKNEAKENFALKAPKKQKVEQIKIVSHKVKKNETLSRIADDYGVTANAIMELNNLKRQKVKTGQILKIETVTTKTTSKNNNSYAAKTTKVHKVKKGENLSMIAAKYDVSEEDLKEMNPKSISGNTLFSGTKLKIPSNESKGSSSAPEKEVNNVPKFYKVRSGETLYSIANKFGLSVKSIQSKNKNLDESGLKSGQKIKLQ
jgi:membrane-bound lytic murein transglycosylase D